ncbi:MAG: hypothetical protein ACIARR_09495, partial [Phycisphaerales bacterium JB059]
MLEPIPLSLSLAGLDPSPGSPWSGGVRAAIAWVQSLGARRVRLDAAAPGVRARELDRSARRDLGGLLRRRELTFTGLDLWIPSAHFEETAHVDRAVDATLGAIRLAGDLARLGDGGGAPVLRVPLGDAPAAGVVAALERAALEAGVGVADRGGGAPG